MPHGVEHQLCPLSLDINNPENGGGENDNNDYLDYMGAVLLQASLRKPWQHSFLAIISGFTTKLAKRESHIKIL
jgi:hypothetical protein